MRLLTPREMRLLTPRERPQGRLTPREILPDDGNERELPGVAATQALDDVLGALTIFEDVTGAADEDAEGLHGL
jgi:hypothetical protein